MNNTYVNRAERRAAHKAQVTETRRKLREQAHKLALAKRYGNKGYVATA